MGAKFVIPTTTRRNTCPHPDPKMTSPKTSGPVRWVQSLLFQQQQEETHVPHPDPKMTSPKTSGPEMGAKFVIPTTTTRNTCPPPRSQDDIPKKSGPEMGASSISRGMW